jgi:hypothetical protein
MKLVYEEGCMGYETSIDDVHIIAADDEEEASLDVVKKVLNTLVNKCENRGTLQDIFISMLLDMGEYEDLGYCEQCGSYSSKYTIEL